VISGTRGVAGAVLARLTTGFVLGALLLFVPAGSIEYREGWLYPAVLFVPRAAAAPYFSTCDPEPVERCMRMRESGQRTNAAAFVLVACGLDHRLGWSDLPVVAPGHGECRRYAPGRYPGCGEGVAAGMAPVTAPGYPFLIV